MGNIFRTAPQVEIIEEPVISIPHHDSFYTSIVATGQRSSTPGEWHLLKGVAVHDETHHIFIANSSNDRVEILSETGEFLYQLEVRQLSRPWGMAIYGDSVYVSCLGDHTVNKFSLTKMCCLRRIGGYGSDNRQFDSPRQLTTDPIGRVYIADSGNDRICIHDPDLNHLRNITHESISRPFDVKVSRNRLYVLCPDISPCMLVLTVEGDKLHSLITRRNRMNVLYPYFFCLDHLNNFVISDFMFDSIFVFTSEGNLLHTIGNERQEPRTFHLPLGVVVTPNRRLVSVSLSDGLKIFC